MQSNTPTEFISPENLGHNQQIINYCRTFLSIIAGCCTGVLGLTGLQGFLSYGVLYAAVSLSLCARMRFKLETFLPPRTTLAGFVFDGITGQGMSFLMFWTLSYGLVHIY